MLNEDLQEARRRLQRQGGSLQEIHAKEVHSVRQEAETTSGQDAASSTVKPNLHSSINIKGSAHPNISIVDSNQLDQTFKSSQPLVDHVDYKNLYSFR